MASSVIPLPSSIHIFNPLTKTTKSTDGPQPLPRVRSRTASLLSSTANTLLGGTRRSKSTTVRPGGSTFIHPSTSNLDAESTPKAAKLQKRGSGHTRQISFFDSTRPSPTTPSSQSQSIYQDRFGTFSRSTPVFSDLSYEHWDTPHTPMDQDSPPSELPTQQKLSLVSRCLSFSKIKRNSTRSSRAMESPAPIPETSERTSLTKTDICLDPYSTPVFKGTIHTPLDSPHPPSILLGQSSTSSLSLAFSETPMNEAPSPQPNEFDRQQARASALAKLTQSRGSPSRSPLATSTSFRLGPGGSRMDDLLRHVPPTDRSKSKISTSTVDSEDIDSSGDLGKDESAFERDIYQSTSSRDSSVDLPQSKLTSGSPPTIHFAELKEDSRSYIQRGLYADRRMAESAIDVLSVVEEDETSKLTTPVSRHRSRLSHPNTDLKIARSPSKRKVRYSDISSTSTSWLDNSATSPTIIPRRKRYSSEVTRSTGVVRPFSPDSNDPDLDNNTVRPSPQSETVPSSPETNTYIDQIAFPSTDTSSDPIGLGPPPSLRKQRCMSDVFATENRRVSAPVSRARHESWATPEDVDMTPLRRNTTTPRTRLTLSVPGKPDTTFQLGECIGKGQFGIVHRALSLESGRVVAVKRIQLEGKTEEEVAQLSHEVALLAGLDHPGVVRYEGLIRSDHYLNIVLEYVENGSLQKTIKNFGNLPEGLVASYVIKILESLNYLHSQAVVHCDLKAANILSTKTGNIKLSDFGVSLNMNAVQNLTDVEKGVAGTPNWMAPEVIELKGASPSSDIWSLGCTIVELLTGDPPYANMLPLSAMYHIVTDAKPPISDTFSPELQDFLSRCFEKEPQDRATAAQLFEHAWLRLYWLPERDLRPQDSIPFARRVGAWDRIALQHTLHLDTEMEQASEQANRTSMAQRMMLAQSTSSLVDFHELARPSQDYQRSHDFIKTSFSKALECRLCHDDTKRHAVLCKNCGLIAHSRCVEYAPLTCDLRSQLLDYESQPSPIVRPTSPTSTLAKVISPFRRKHAGHNLNSDSGITPTSSPMLTPAVSPIIRPDDRRSFSDLILPSRASHRSSNSGSKKEASGEDYAQVGTISSLGSSRSRVEEPCSPHISLTVEGSRPMFVTRTKDSTQEQSSLAKGATHARHKSFSRRKREEDCVIQ